jgi:hypothetical protein
VSSIPRFWFTLPVHLALLAGTIAAIVMLVRHRSLAAGLALAGFGGLFLVRILYQLWDIYLIRQLMPRGIPGLPFETLRWIRPISGCCCNAVGALAAVCLLIGFWKAVTGETTGGSV